ncbi:MAG TPA: fatty acid desaturase [Polyangiaceae bacterium]|nr:fatty acid desaturase [Polyangiaceae bacterium]
MPAVAVAQFVWPRLTWWLLPASMYLAYCSAVIAHNHNHSPTFAGRCANTVFAQWISMFYGYPVFAWIPTHNLNHHRYVNRPGDATITSAAGRENGLLAAASFFFVSSKAQAPLVASFLRRARARSLRAYVLFVSQYVLVYGGHAAACAAAMHMYGFAVGASIYASSLGLPALFALWAIMFTNYVQHVDCDPWSDYDHSRNFVSPWMNALVFDNGYHTVHHDHPGLHWSKLRAEHARVAHRIAPRLNESSILGYCWRAYFLARLRAQGEYGVSLTVKSKKSGASKIRGHERPDSRQRAAGERELRSSV